LGYVHSASGMLLSHGLSLLSERVGERSWPLPLGIGWVGPQSDPPNDGVAHLQEFVKRYGWSSEQVRAVDAPLHGRAVSQSGSPVGHFCPGACSQQSLFLLAAPYPGFRRPPVRGRKIKLNDARTLPKVEAKVEWELAGGGRIEVSHCDDVRM
jgi:hypothetical protein